MLAFCADTHISPRLWQSLPDVTGDSYSSWRQIVNACVTKGVAGLILGGDIFDSIPVPDDVHCFLSGLNQLRQAKIPVLAIQGQHGRSRSMPWPAIDEYVVNLDGRTDPVELDGRKIVGIDNCSSTELREKLSNLPKSADTLVVHQMLEGLAGNMFSDMKPEWVPDHIKLVLMGDLHMPLETSRATPNHVQRFIYNGSTVIRSISEPAEKSFILINGDTLSRERLMTRPVLEFCVYDGSTDALKKLVTDLQNIPDDGIAYIRVDPRIPDVDALCRGANRKIHYIIRPIVITDTSAKQEVLTSSEVSLAGCLSALVDKEKDPLFHDFVLSLLESTSPVDVLKLFKHKVMGEANA